MRAVVRKTNEGLLFAAPGDTVQAVPFEDGRAVDLTIDDGRLIVTADGATRGVLHPARLNMGDCFAYARARNRGLALLHKGDDFARTIVGVP